ncbi:MAG: translation initiation factor IF-2 subunit beta [Candidatus Heimdallarchaeaceae archaeon]|uniref:Translation initiation factor 2 subunit beta n=1 Tax=Candidatus Heimdallarchaeum endolithica TaxID=2876572 RepID=A0A9Y1BPF5_9ARCH|nr:MAG: translation initiation factor IF-2 subunit beta [Candidatus Heimdallarchaeum endolithica]
MSYDELLKRARKQLPEKVFEEDRFKIPKVQAVIEGNKTIVTNFKQIATLINREENHLLKYLAGELATSAAIEGSRAVFAGKHSRYNLQKLLEKYLEEYVRCGECHKYDTHFETISRILYKRCEACGATTAVKPLRK